MALISKSIPNLLGGVSQQPDAVRFDNQCDTLDNGLPSVLDGLIKRPPTEHIVNIDSSAPGSAEDYFTHIVNLDRSNQYAVVIKADGSAVPTIKVSKLDGTGLATVHTSDALSNYLQMAAGYDAEKDLRAITIADYTFIINRSKTVAMTSDVDTIGNPEALFYVKTGDYGTLYTAIVTIGGVVYKTEVTTPSGAQNKAFDEDGLIKSKTFDSRDAIDTSNIAKAFSTGTALGFNSFLYPQNATNDEGHPDGGTIVEYADSVRIGPGELIFQADSSSDKITFATATNDTITDNSTGGEPNFLVAGLEAGDKIFCTGSAESGNNHRIFQIHTVTADVITITEGSVLTAAVEEEAVKIFKVDSSSVVGTLHSAEVGIRNAAGIAMLRQGSVISLKSDDTTDFTVTASDGLGNDALKAIKDEISLLTTLPTVAPNGFRMKVVGSADSSVDDYYVKFEAENGTFGTGVYKEFRDKGITYKLDASTMPHVLIKETDGTFRFAKLDGTALTVGPTTYPVVQSWNERNVGDLTTNPNPTFVGKRLNDVFIFKNRLGFLADENVILSETSEFFNFFRILTIDLLDTSPIDVASTHSSVSILTAAVPFSSQLVLFSDATQFVLGSGQSALTPKTVTMTKTTSYESVSDIKPIGLGSSTYFGFTRGDFSGIRQYSRSSDTETIFDAEDISAQIPQYIEGALRGVTGSTHEDVMFCITNTNRHLLYCYKFHKQGDNQVQSAWSRFTFANNSGTSVDEILGIEFVDTTLYLIVKRADGIFLDKMRLESGLVDSDVLYRTHLDRRVDQSDCSLSGDGKTITMPYKAYTGVAIEIITKSGDRIPVITQTNDSNQVVINESLTGIDFWLGEAYTFTYKFSDIVLRETTGSEEVALVSQGRKQVRYLTLDYHDTSFFKVTVAPDLRETVSSYSFTARILGSGENIIGSIPLDSGVFRVPVYSKADQVAINIVNDSPLPCAITSAEFELLFNARSKRYS